MLPDLCAELYPLTHRQRVARVVAWGRAPHGPDADRLAALRGGDAWCRRLAVYGEYTRRSPWLLEALSDPSRGVRQVALRAILRVMGEAAQAAALGAVRSPTARHRLVCALAGRPAIDRWLEAALAGDEQAARAAIDLLAFGSRAFVSAQLARFVDRASVVGWTRLLRRHPDLLFGALFAEGDAPPDARARHVLASILPGLAARAPDEALAVARALLRRGVPPTDPLWRNALQTLARRRPAPTFDALRAAHEAAGPQPAPGAFRGISFHLRTETLGVDRLLWLTEHAWTSLPEGERGRRWLRRLSDPDRARLVEGWLARGRGPWGAFLLAFAEPGPAREAAYLRWRAASADARGLIAISALDPLPDDLRAREARAHLASPELATTPERRLPYAALLPWADAREALVASLGHPDGEVRALAAAALFGAVRRDRAAVDEALKLAHARRNEQDPVRRALLSAMADWRPGVWLRDGGVPEARLAALDQVINDALSASDLSATSASRLETVVLRLFRHDPAWGASALERLARARGSLSGGGLLVGLPRSTFPSLIPALSNLGRTWLVRERWSTLSWLCSSLGPRLREVPALLDCLEAVARETPFPGSAGAALALLRWQAPSVYARVALDLVRADASVALLDEVAELVSREAQDLLDRLLVSPMTGRYATGKTAVVLTFKRGYARWNPAQQRRQAELHGRVIADPGASLWQVQRSVDELARLDYLDPSPLLALVSDPRQPVRETAVRALARLDGPGALPALIGCLGDDRGRVAIYALRQCLSDLPPEAALDALLAAPRDRVTVAKEVLRLLGELCGEPGRRALLRIAAEPLHRDVHIALLRALWSHLDHDETWEIFRAAAAHPDPVVASRLAEVCTSWLTPASDARFCQILANVLARPEVEARTRLLRASAGLCVRDAERVYATALRSLLASPNPGERKLAFSAVIARMIDEDAPPLADSILALRDRPDALRDLVDALAASQGWRIGRVLAVRAPVRAALLADPRWAALGLRLCVQVEPTVLADAITQVATAGALGWDATAAAIGAIHAQPHPDELEALLRDAADPALRRLGLAALDRAAEADGGWTEARKHTLATYRADPSPRVAGPAALVFTG